MTVGRGIEHTHACQRNSRTIAGSDKRSQTSGFVTNTNWWSAEDIVFRASSSMQAPLDPNRISSATSPSKIASTAENIVLLALEKIVHLRRKCAPVSSSLPHAQIREHNADHLLVNAASPQSMSKSQVCQGRLLRSISCDENATPGDSRLNSEQMIILKMQRSLDQLFLPTFSDAPLYDG